MNGREGAPERPDISPEFLVRKAWNIRWAGRDESIRLATEALSMVSGAAAVRTGTEGLAFRTLAWQAKWRGLFDDSEEFGAKALARLDPALHAAAIADVHSIMRVIHYSRGRRDMARESVRLGYAALCEREAAETRVDLMTTEATILRYGQRIEDSRKLLEAALELAEGTERSRVRHNMARALQSAGQTAEALSLATNAVIDARRFDNRVILPYALEVLGTCYAAFGQHEAARGYLLEGEEIGREDTDLRVRCQILQQLACIEEKAGKPEMALMGVRKGLGIDRKMVYPLWEKHFLRHQSDMAEALGRKDKALEALKRLCALQAAERE